MSLSVAEKVGTDGGDRMLKSQRAPLVSVTCSSDLLRRVQGEKKRETQKAAVLQPTVSKVSLCRL